MLYTNEPDNFTVQVEGLQYCCAVDEIGYFEDFGHVTAADRKSVLRDALNGSDANMLIATITDRQTSTLGKALEAVGFRKLATVRNWKTNRMVYLYVKIRKGNLRRR